MFEIGASIPPWVTRRKVNVMRNVKRVKFWANWAFVLEQRQSHDLNFIFPKELHLALDFALKCAAIQRKTKQPKFWAPNIPPISSVVKGTGQSELRTILFYE